MTGKKVALFNTADEIAHRKANKVIKAGDPDAIYCAMVTALRDAYIIGYNKGRKEADDAE